MSNIKKKKDVFFDGGLHSFGRASTSDEARELAWNNLPLDIKKQIKKEDLKPEEFKNSWLV